MEEIGDKGLEETRKGSNCDDLGEKQRDDIELPRRP
jgi:hypothetical protein